MRSYGFVAVAILSCSLFASAAQKTRQASLTVSVPGQASLAASDVTLTVGGKAATVVAAPVINAVVAPDAKLDEATTELPESIANPIIFVFDAMDTKELEDRDMRKHVLKFMADAASKKQAVGLVMMYQDGIYAIHDYRVGSAVLAAALAKVNGGTAPAVPGAEATVAAEARRLGEFAKGTYSTQAADNMILLTSLESPVYMMQEIAAAMRDVPGRKAIVWISAGVPFDIDNHALTSLKEFNNGAAVNGAVVTSTKRIATDDQIRKLQPLWHNTLFNLWDSGTAVYPVEARSAVSSPAGPTFTSAMTDVAQMTGGRTFFGMNDPASFFSSIEADNAAATRVTFSMETPNDNWQKLVISSGKGKVLAPSGLFPPDADDARKKALGIALNSHFGFAGVPFRLTVGEQTANGAKKTVKFSVFLPPNAGVVDEKAGEVNLDVAAVAFGKKNEKAGTMSTSAGGKLPADALKQIAETGVNISKTIDVSPGTYTLRVIVRDNLTGRIGSIETGLDVK